MLYEPLDLPDEQEQAIESALENLSERLEEYVGDVLAEIDSKDTGRQIRYVAFEANEVLPKRSYRPTVVIHHIVGQIYRSHATDCDSLDQLLRTTVVAMEYYDIADDVIDGDVAQGHEAEAFLTNELLMPLLVRHLGRLGPEAIEHWSEDSIRTAESWVFELSNDPSAATYRTLVDKQSELFGSMTALSAVTAGADDAAIERAGEIGRTYFKYDQFVLDLRQYEKGDEDPWNAWNLMGEDEAKSYLMEQRSEFERLIGHLPRERQRLLRPLVATDIDAFRASVAQ